MLRPSTIKSVAAGCAVSLRHASFATLVLSSFLLAISAPAIAPAAPAPQMEFVQSSLEPQPVVRDRSPELMEGKADRLTAGMSSESTRVWVFFTDKDVRNQAEFLQRAAGITLTDRALQRRARVGRDRVVFADLPVVERYVSAIEALGADHRRSSRWLNAATFEVTPEQLGWIIELPFVADIRPMQTFVRDLPEPEEIKYEAPPEALAPDALSYGLAAAQLTQINVPPAHDAGYTGEGVTLAIMDTGYRKSHTAFAQHYANSRVLAEWDFINDDNNTANEAEDNDWSTQWNHGTLIWSVSAGEDPDNLYGPAFEANIILCKTEDIRSETHAEEDNWVAALEFADSVGTDVITTSLGYSSFDSGVNYTFEDMDGETAIISIAASTTAGLGIVMCNSMGNSGPSSGSLSAPADAFDILSVGNVNSSGFISVSSSRGPTADGRTKPEVCARGTSTSCASPYDDNGYTSASGTSLSTPLVAGAACLVIEANPDWTPYQVREALMLTADRASTPDNDYGWGIIDVWAAINYSFPCCEGTVGNVDGSADQEVGLGDLTALVDNLFISLEPVDCAAEADLDKSGAPEPTQQDIGLADLTILVDHLFISLDPLPACP
ncbi:S8 family serine peptidase [candidate division GN15 bacterium]|nr:S8 family serine peptidase [candidate division GN15 bacterium]